jgi:hypothetical protein
MIQPIMKIMPATKLDLFCTLLVIAVPVYIAAAVLAVVMFPVPVAVVWNDLKEAAVMLWEAVLFPCDHVTLSGLGRYVHEYVEFHR